MLVLSRKPHEVIDIRVGGVDIEIKLVSIHAGRAKIGIEAPRHVAIVRREVDRDAKETTAPDPGEGYAAVDVAGGG